MIFKGPHKFVERRNMKKYTELELKDILEKHFLWLKGDPNGERANLCGANFYGANLYESKGANYPINCPEKGSFIGFKRVRGDFIVELEIAEDALRSSATGKKCRCSKAKVLSITNIDGTESNVNSARSLWDPDFVYTVGETIEVPNFDTNRWIECAPGIHFFITRKEAVDFIM